MKHVKTFDNYNKVDEKNEDLEITQIQVVYHENPSKRGTYKEGYYIKVGNNKSKKVSRTEYFKLYDKSGTDDTIKVQPLIKKDLK